MTVNPATDSTMEAVGQAVAAGRAGQVEDARARLHAIWEGVGVTGDPLHRCTIAHYLADLYDDDPAHALAWDVRALDAADALTQDRAQQHDASLHVAGFYPSLHLNLADNYRRLGSLTFAAEHVAAARRHAVDLAQDPYGDFIRTIIEEVAGAVAAGATGKRPLGPAAA
jgi:hypothetical protein